MSDVSADTVTSALTSASMPRSLAKRAADTINVKDFGAAGNGVDDDLAAINLALYGLAPL